MVNTASITHWHFPLLCNIYTSISSSFSDYVPSLLLCLVHSPACYSVKVMRRLTVQRSDRGELPGSSESCCAICAACFYLFIISLKQPPTIACFPWSYDEWDCGFSPFCCQDPGDHRSHSEGQRQLVCSGHTRTWIMLPLHHTGDSFSEA